MSNQKIFGPGFINLPDTGHLKRITLSNIESKKCHCIDNIPGKQASVKILYNIAVSNQSIITNSEAAVGLNLFGDYANEEQQQPNSHPNIRFLINIINNNEQWHLQSE